MKTGNSKKVFSYIFDKQNLTDIIYYSNFELLSSR